MLSIITDIHPYVNGQNQTAIIYGRVSSRQQAANGNLANQARFMLSVCQQHGLNVIETVASVEWGRSLSLGRDHLKHAISLATHYKAVIVAFSLLRLIRQRYASESAVRTIDRQWLIDHPLTFLTVVDPNASLAEIKSQEIKLGISSRNPVDELIAKILHWHNLGMSVRNIAAYLKQPKSTVYDLLKSVRNITTNVPHDDHD